MLGERDLTLVDCPECGFPALVEHRFAVRSTDGPVSHAVTMCVQLHRLSTPEPQAIPERREAACEETTVHDAGTP